MCTVDEGTRIISPCFVDIHISRVTTQKCCQDVQIRYFMLSTNRNAGLSHT